MDSNAKKVLKSARLPEYVFKLLEAYGYRNIADISTLNEIKLDAIETAVRTGKMDDKFDTQSKSERMKYLGFDCLNLEKFSIIQMDREKIINDLRHAIVVIYESTANSEASLGKRQGSEDLNQLNEMGPSTSKQVRKEIAEKSVPDDTHKINISERTIQLINVTNKFWELTSVNERATAEDIKLSLDGQKPKASIRCLICKKFISLATNKMTLSLSNYTRHVKCLHITTEYSKKAPPKQKLLTEFLRQGLSADDVRDLSKISEN